jgi:hypothetical protein
VQASARSIKSACVHCYPYFKDIAALVSSPFMHLISLNISSVLTAYHFLILVDNDWPLLRKLKLKLIFSDTTLVIQKLVAAPWSQLEELDLGPSTLKIPDAQLLVRKWFEGTAVVSTCTCHIIEQRNCCCLQSAREQLESAAVH